MGQTVKKRQLALFDDHEVKALAAVLNKGKRVALDTSKALPKMDEVRYFVVAATVVKNEFQRVGEDQTMTRTLVFEPGVVGEIDEDIARRFLVQ